MTIHYLQQQARLQQTRRHFFCDCRLGLGKIALASLLSESLAVQQTRGSEQFVSPYAAKSPHFSAKVKRVIFLFMAGGPSQLDMFDHKPRLTEFEGKSLPASVIQGQRYAFIQSNAAVLGPRYRFAKQGKCGAEICEAMPHLARVVDDIAIVRSVFTDHFNHAPAQLFINTGNGVPGRPSLGAWLSYGIGSEASDLPSFVVLKSGSGSNSGGAALWSAGFLPSVHQGVPFREQGTPILHSASPPGIDDQAQRETIDLLHDLNRDRWEQTGDPEILTRLHSYEMAYRIQSRAPELMDYSQETQATLDLYGAKPHDSKAAFANNCLLARRLAERGVRFIQLYHSGWDHHSDVAGGVRDQCAETDQAAAALLTDLQRLGLLKETLVVWGGEFGRTPMVEASATLGRTLGRDHHPQAFTMWFAGGGIRGGLSLGQTDDFGFRPVERPVHIHDVQATILHCLGIDHRALTYRLRGLDFRLTGVEEHHPVHELLS